MDMEDNKKIYLDKILKWFVDDTIIRYVTGIIIYPFSPIGPMGKPLPSFIDDLKNKLSWGMPSDIQITCRDTYGLNYDETKYIWDNYKTIIKDRYNKESIMYDLKPINESVDNKKRYLDKVVDFLVDDTRVDHDYRMIFFPFTYKRSLRQGSVNLTPFHRLLFETYIPIDGFIEYIKELYEISSDEDIVYIWETYKGIMKDVVFGKEDINESMDRRDDYLDKIVDFLVDDTIIDYKRKKINFPFINPHLPPPLTIAHLFFPNSSFWLPSISSPYPDFIRFFSRYCIDTYGLTEDEIDYVWQKVSKILLDKINNKESINESVDKISKGEYLDKIVDYLVDDTMVDQKNKVWTPPFPTDHANPTFNHFYGLIPMTDHLELKFLIGNSYVRNFFNYCKDTYGLTDDKEIRKVWERYLKVLTPIINGYSIINGIPTMNESEDKQKRYLDKIVDFLVYDTKMDYVKGKVWYPFMSDGITNAISFSPETILSTEVPSPFEYYVNTTYFIDWDSTEYVWKKYISIMMDKYKGNNINESVDRKSDYLDKVVEFLVVDTKVDHKQEELTLSLGSVGVKIIYFSDFLWNTKHFLTDIPSYFSNYIKDTYGLSGDEIRYVWEQYRYTIRDKILSKPINESVDRKDEYLDKIVEFLVSDTEISNEEGDRSFKPSFTSIWFSPVYLKKMSDHMLERNFFNYCKDSYGLTNSEVNGVWSKYKKNILNIFKDPINESVDRKGDLIDKISDYMVDDTEYELSISQYNVDSTEIFVNIRYPYSAQDSGFPYTIYEVSTIKESSEYILNRVEIEYMWDVYNIRTVKTIEDIFKKYTEKLFTKIYDDMLRVKGNNINESVDRKSDYLDKIVDFMIDDTEYNIYINRFSDHSETKVEIWYPFTNPDEDEDEDAYDYSIYDIYDWSNGSGFNLDEGEDIDYICNTYSICDIDTVQELYDRYIQKLSTIIYEEMLLKKNGEFINESIDRKDEYLNKIVEFLVTDTKVSINDDIFFAPFYRLSSLSYNLLFYKGDYPASFYEYCRNTYSLTDYDTKYVWDTYKNIIIDKFDSE